MHVGGLYCCSGGGYTGRYLNGTLDELRVWTRALTTKEVRARAAHGSFPPLCSHAHALHRALTRTHARPPLRWAMAYCRSGAPSAGQSTRRLSGRTREWCSHRSARRGPSAPPTPQSPAARSRGSRAAIREPYPGHRWRCSANRSTTARRGAVGVSASCHSGSGFKAIETGTVAAAFTRRGDRHSGSFHAARWTQTCPSRAARYAWARRNGLARRSRARCAAP